MITKEGELMAVRKKGLASYGEVEVQSGTAYADSVQLIQMLFDGLIDSLAAAEGHIERNEIQAKGESLSRATRIVLGLQGSLDIEEGGEIAGNLADLYDYCARRLLHANLKNDLDAVREVRQLMGEIRDAWAQVPDLIEGQVAVNFG
jgi:flagellar protein FliS